MCFNLLDAPWIPVIRTNGEPDKVGIRRALTEAADIREVCAASPLDTIALYRFLLAVLQWCKPDPEQADLDEVRRNRGFKALLGKLEEHGERFELLGETYGFYQDEGAWQEVERKLKAAAGKKPKRKPSREAEGKVGGLRPPTDLLQELPSGTNVAHFRHTRDFREGICPACCALGIVRLSAFAVSRKHGKEHQMPAGINGPTPMYALPLGENLLQSLLLNWPMPSKENDQPGWILDRGPDEDDIGPLAAFTWRPRCLWLERPSPDASGERCSYCGRDDYPLVHRIAYVPGWPRKPWSDDDPHFLMRVEQPKPRSDKKPEAKPMPLSFANPSSNIDVQARHWRQVYRAILQAFLPEKATRQHKHLRAAIAKADAGKEVVVACAGPAVDVGRAALYKDGAALKWRLPAVRLSGETAGKGISELDWLNEIKLWGVLKKAIPRKAAKRPEITAAVSNAAVGAEARLRQLFQGFVETLVRNDVDSPRDWREGAQDCLAKELREACRVIRTGSSLRRNAQEAAVNAGFQAAITEATGREEGNDEPN